MFSVFKSLYPSVQVWEAQPLPVLEEGEPLPACRRLVVLLPYTEINQATLPSRIWRLAAPKGIPVLLLSAPASGADEFNARVTLSMLAALIRDAAVKVQIQVLTGVSLATAVRQSSQQGDVFVCVQNPLLSDSAKWKKIMGDVSRMLQAPIYTLGGELTEPESFKPSGWSDILLLSASPIFLIGFFILQAWIDRTVTGFVQTLAQTLTVLVETGWIAICTMYIFKPRGAS